MSHERLEPERASALELEARQRAEQAGLPFLLYRDGRGDQRIRVLQSKGPLVIGRTLDADLVISWDDRVSRRHARLELVGDDPASDWTVVDDVPSRNGTFVNGNRVTGRVRLTHGDRLTFADTPMLFCAAATRTRGLPTTPAHDTVAPDSPTIIATVRLTRESLSDVERRVLEALARRGGPPRSDEQIASTTYLSLATVQATIAALCQRVGLHELPEDERRRLLTEQALRSGVLGGER
ncbi:MAG TPA: FHA domain-containing protein [Solirubrobacteraceae bacterium]